MKEKQCLCCNNVFVVGGRENGKKDQLYCSIVCSNKKQCIDKYKDTLWCKEWLIKKYIEEKLSLREIGSLVGGNSTVVSRALKQAEIKRRSISEGRKTTFDKKGRKNVTQEELIIAYGGKCVCCGEKEHAFLTLDHIEGGGNKHRQRLRTKGKNPTRVIRQELKEQGWPKDKYRLLCMNCNHATRHSKKCPHKLKNKNEEIEIENEIFLSL